MSTDDVLLTKMLELQKRMERISLDTLEAATYAAELEKVLGPEFVDITRLGGNLAGALIAQRAGIINTLQLMEMGIERRREFLKQAAKQKKKPDNLN